MESIIVTVDNPGMKQSYDLELPVKLSIYKLAQDIVDTINADGPPLKWSIHNAVITRAKTNTCLYGHESLESAGVANGEKLIFSNAR